MSSQPVLVNLSRECVGFTLRQVARTTAQVRPLRLDFRDGLCMAGLSLNGVPCFQAPRDFAAAKRVDEVSGNPPPEPIDSGLGMLMGTAHRKDHV